MPSNPRMQIIEEMMQERVQSVSAERVAVFTQPALHVRDQVHNLGVSLDFEHVAQLD